MSQQLTDELTVNLVMQALLQFKFLELPAFKKLVTTLQPRLHIMTKPRKDERPDAYYETKFACNT